MESISLLQESNNISTLSNKISECCDNIINALNISFDKVSSFTNEVWKGVVKGDLFVDKIIHYLTNLKQHLKDFYKAIQEKKTDFKSSQVIPFLYTIEAKLINIIQSNTFLYNTFGRFIKGITNYTKHIRLNTIIS